MEAVLAVRDVVKQFRGVRAVDGVSFEVRRGTITGLLGRNGAGKTTTIRMITGIFHPDRGSIEALGSPAGALAVRDRIGYLPEERGLYKSMKVLEHLLFLGEIKGRRHAETRAVAERWLRRLELWERREAKIEEISRQDWHDTLAVILDGAFFCTQGALPLLPAFRRSAFKPPYSIRPAQDDSAKNVLAIYNRYTRSPSFSSSSSVSGA